MKQKISQTKSKKPDGKTPGKKEDKAENKNDQGGIPDMDFKKLLGCG